MNGYGKTNKKFKNCYFMSSMLLCSFFILITSSATFFKYIFNDKGSWNSYNGICFLINIIIALILFIWGVGGIFIIRKIIKNISTGSAQRQIKEVKLNTSFNEGIWEFIFSYFLPLFSSFSLYDYPVATTLICWGSYIIIYYFNSHSSDLLPNIFLIVFNYGIVRGNSTLSINGYQINMDVYIIVPLKNKEKYLGQKKANCIFLGDRKQPLNIGIIKE
ncbi:hypothetical protein [Catellicoccus marimammalium]|uniref:Uncharacterized protein n=2 Tax=Catellicoccus TaxID=300418 RepID=K8Z8D5_9ENTE|nr:hypothetical protein [Catellicoccus marimammalium]EKU27309.1 hypothetical protein C683_0640 [Catellicoccus marimammalium M35/04/3]